MSTKTIVPRGCGLPKAGMIYLAADQEEKGKFRGRPTKSFILDPTWRLPEEFVLSDIGMRIQARTIMGKGLQEVQAYDRMGNPIYDIWDHIGGHSYPNPTDWYEEVDRLGFHQLIERTAEFHKLSVESQYFAVHDRAFIGDPLMFYANMKGKCPLDNPFHRKAETCFETCFELLYENLIQGNNIKGREVTRTMPSFSYTGWKAPEDYDDAPERAAFFRFPIGKLAKFRVYEDTEQGLHESALKALEELDQSLKRIEIVKL